MYLTDRLHFVDNYHVSVFVLADRELRTKFIVYYEELGSIHSVY